MSGAQQHAMASLDSLLRRNAMKLLSQWPSLVAALILAGTSFDLEAQQVKLVSKPIDPLVFGLQGSGDSDNCDLSGAGRYLVFSSLAANLVADDTNGVEDIFVLDRDTGQVNRVSVDSAGNQGDRASKRPRISTNGRYVVFESEATNLVADDSNGVADVFRHDRQTGETIRVSLFDNGTVEGPFASLWPSISSDGDRVAFVTESDLVGDDTNGVADAYVRFVAAEQTTRVSTDPAFADPDFATYRVVISGDGEWVAFESQANNIVPGDTGGQIDIFHRNITSGVTTRVLGLAGASPNGHSDIEDISTDGQLVLFQSHASNYVANDNNGLTDVFVFDAGTGLVELISTNPLGETGNGISQYTRISGGGRYVVFGSGASDLVSPDTNSNWDVFLRDRLNLSTELVSVSSAGVQGSGRSDRPCISASGDLAGFTSDSDELIAGDDNRVKDVFVRNFGATTTELGSHAGSAGPFPVFTGNRESQLASISDDGRFAAFRTLSTNFLPIQPGFFPLIYRVDLRTGDYALVNVMIGGAPDDSNTRNRAPSMDRPGNRIAFSSPSSQLVPGDSNGVEDVFVRDMDLAMTRRVSVDSAGAEASGHSYSPTISANGRFVTFVSNANNLVADDTNGHTDIFVHDMVSNQTRRVSISSGGNQASGPSDEPDINATGRYITFHSTAVDLVASDLNPQEDVYRHDRTTGTTELVSINDAGQQVMGVHSHARISDDGQRIVFQSDADDMATGDNNGRTDIFVRDMQAGTTTLISLNPDGLQFTADSKNARISADGQTIVFDVESDTSPVQVYMYDPAIQATRLISRRPSGQPVPHDSHASGLSADGQFVLFESDSHQLVENDFNGVRDVFVYRLDQIFADSFASP
jgi:Tol biopolymer transport system component